MFSRQLKMVPAAVLAASLLSGCSEALSDDAQSVSSEEQLQSGTTCRGLELEIIGLSNVFDQAMVEGSFAEGASSAVFFEELNEFSEELVSTSFSTSALGEKLKTAANLTAQAVASLEGPMSAGFDPSEVGTILREPITALFTSCEEYIDISTNPEQLFLAPDLVEFSLSIPDDFLEDPIVKRFDSAGINCEWTLPPTLTDIVPDESNPISKLKPHVASLCKSSDGTFFLARRHSSNIESKFAANVVAKALPTIDGSPASHFYSDQFSVMAYSGQVEGWHILLEMTPVSP